MVTTFRGVAKDKSMYRHHIILRGRGGVRGMTSLENVDILYRRSCILEHFMAYFEGLFLYFEAFAKTKKIIPC